MRLLALSPLLLFALATPGAAQIVGERSYESVLPPNPFLPDSSLPGPSVWRELGDIRRDIRVARVNGWLSRREARQLRREARRLAYAAARYGRDGLSPSERHELQARAETLRGMITRP